MVCDCDQPSCQERKIWGKRVNYKRKELGYHAAMSSEWKESIREPIATWYLFVLDLLCIEHKSLGKVKICVLYSKIDGYDCDKDQEHTTAFISCSLWPISQWMKLWLL